MYINPVFKPTLIQRGAKALLGVQPTHPVARYFRDFAESIRFADFRGFLSAERAYHLQSTNAKVVDFQAIGPRMEAAMLAIVEDLHKRHPDWSIMRQQGASFAGYHFFDGNHVPNGWLFYTADKEERNQIYVTGEDHLVSWCAAEAQRLLPLESKKIVNVTAVTSQGLQQVDSYIRHDEVDIAHPEFYPWLVDTTPSEYMQKYLDNRGSVLLLIGPPGTAKTTFLRQFMMTQGRDKEIMFTSNKEVATSQDLVNSFQRSEADILVMEDADEATRAREKGNDAMSVLLNVANGVITNNKKIVISTNLESVQMVDKALTRPGRCYDILTFRRLTPKEAALAFRAVHPNEKLPDFSVQDDWSVAELLHAHQTNGTTSPEARKRVSMGFAPA